MRTLVLDIETGEDRAYTSRDDFLDRLAADCKAPSNWKKQDLIDQEILRQVTAKRERLALSPATGRVIAIAWGWIDAEEIHVHTGTEDAIIGDFLSFLGCHGRAVLAGFNIRMFDLPFLAVRAAINDIELPIWWPHARDYRFVADARDVLEDGKLDDWLHRFDLPAKKGSGDQAQHMQPQQLRDYVEHDVRVERLLLRRLERALPAIRDNRNA